MGLYRNIAGEQIGILQAFAADGGSGSGFFATESPIMAPPTINLLTPVAIQASTDAYMQQQTARYDQALTTSLDDLHQLGIFVTTDNGSLFISNTPPYTGGVPDAKAWLPIQDIQQIENQRGTAGALLLHLQEPALAKDTAGHDSGSSTTWSGSTGTASTPIPQVQSLPPVTTTPDGTVTFQAPGSTSSLPTEVPISAPTTATVSPGTIPVSQPLAAAGKPDTISLVALAGALVIAVTGDGLIHHRSKLVFAGGIGLLYYLLNRHSTQTT